MKVNKHAEVKHKSHKWKDAKGKRCRPPVSFSNVNSSPVVISMVKEHQESLRKKTSVKRLKNKVKSVSNHKNGSSESGIKKTHPQANGSSVFTMDNDSDDSQDWKEYSQSVHGNGMETSDNTEDVRRGRLEGEALHHCAQRDDRENRTVLVMQKDQVCVSWFLVGHVDV